MHFVLVQTKTLFRPRCILGAFLFDFFLVVVIEDPSFKLSFPRKLKTALEKGVQTARVLFAGRRARLPRRRPFAD